MELTCFLRIRSSHEANKNSLITYAVFYDDEDIKDIKIGHYIFRIIFLICTL